MQAGMLIYYDMDGTVIGTEAVSLPANARLDFLGGQQFGKYRVGLIEWKPEDPAASFQVRNVRYLPDNQVGIPSFDAAFQLEAVRGSGELLSVPLDTHSASAIIEVVNTTTEEVAVEVKIYTDQGELKETVPFRLLPKASYHLITDEILGPDAYGTATIEGSKAGSVIAVAMQYGRNADDSIRYMYGLQAQQSLGQRLRTSYNTFLSQSSEDLGGESNLRNSTRRRFR